MITKRKLAHAMLNAAWQQRAHDIWAFRNGKDPDISHTTIASEYTALTGKPWPYRDMEKERPLPIRTAKFKVSTNGVR